MKNILVIGGDSFIAKKFIDEFKSIFCIKTISRVLTEHNNEKVLENLFELEIDSFNEIDVVINFAAIVHQPQIKDEVIYDKINFELPVFIAKMAKSAEVKHFIQMSTIAVYGDVNNITDASEPSPLSFYGKSKLKADIALRELETDDFIVSSIRPPMVYGGGAAPGNMMKLLKFTLKGYYMPFKGINNNRDFINVNNLLICFAAVINNSIGGIVLPTDRHAVSTEDIIRSISKSNGITSRLIHPPMIFLRFLNLLKPSLYSKVFGSLTVECNLNESIYSPSYSLNDGIKEMLEAYKINK